MRRIAPILLMALLLATAADASPHFSPGFLGNDVAHALCVPRRHSWRRSDAERCVAARRSVEKSLDTARVGACATSSGGL